MIASVLKVGLVIGTFGGVALALAPPSSSPSFVAPPAKTEKPGMTTVAKTPSPVRKIKIQYIPAPQPVPYVPVPKPAPIEPRPVLALLPAAPVVVEKETPRPTQKVGPRRCQRPGATARSWYRIKGVKYFCRARSP